MEAEFLPEPDLAIDQSAGIYLKETTKWTRFLAISLCVFMGLMLFGALIMLLAKDVIMQSLDKSPSPFLKLGFTMIFFVVIIVVGFLMIPTYYLFRFSNQTKKGIDQKDEYALETGIASLRTYFTIFGVLGLLSLFISLIRLIMLAF